MPTTAWEIPGLKYGQLLAGADLSGGLFTFVKVHASGRLVQCSVAGEDADGVLYNKPTSGQAAEVCGTRICKVKIGAAVTAGDKLTTDTSGRAITGSSTNFYLGKALESGAAAGEIIPMLMKNGKI